MSNYEKKVCKIGEREYYVFETEIGGRTMSVEIGNYAEQAKQKLDNVLAVSHELDKYIK